MKRIFILFIAAAFLGIAGCERFSGKKSSEESSNQGSDQVNALKLNFEKETNQTVPTGTNVEVIEPIVTIGTQEPVIVERHTEGIQEEAVSSKESIPQEKSMNPEKVSSIVKDHPIEVSKKSSRSVSSYKGSYIRVGRDRSGQIASPRLPIQITAVVFSESPWGKYADFKLYAIPTRLKFTKSAKYLISSYHNILLVNGQAQLTKFWNGKNIYGRFLGKGNYNIYLYYRIKNRTKKIIYSKGRFWGRSRSYYIRLY